MTGFPPSGFRNRVDSLDVLVLNKTTKTVEQMADLDESEGIAAPIVDVHAGGRGGLGLPRHFDVDAHGHGHAVVFQMFQKVIDVALNVLEQILSEHEVISVPVDSPRGKGD